MATHAADTGAPQEPRAGFFTAGKVSNSRSLFFYVVGVVAGLILGGVGLFNARGTITNRLPPENIALVNGQPILRSDFVTQLELETGHSFAESTREEQLKVLDEMLREELFVQRGLEMNFGETDPDTRAALYSIVEQMITADAVISQPDEAELRAYFDEHRDDFTTDGVLTARHFVLPGGAAAAADEAAAALRGGAPEDAIERFALVEAEDSGAAERYFLAEVHLGEALFASASKLGAGEVAGPVLQDGSYHIAKVLANTRPERESFEAARDKVESAYTRAAQARIVNNMFRFLLDRSTILITDDYESDYDPADFEDEYVYY